MTNVVIRAVPVTAMLFGVPIIFLFAAISVLGLFDFWSSPFPPTRRTAIFLFAALGLVAGIVAAIVARSVQRRLAPATLSLPGHFLVGWPVYLGVGWLALIWFGVSREPGSLRPSGAQLALAYAFVLAEGTALLLHLALSVYGRRKV